MQTSSLNRDFHRTHTRRPVISSRVPEFTVWLAGYTHIRFLALLTIKTARRHRLLSCLITCFVQDKWYVLCNVCATGHLLSVYRLIYLNGIDRQLSAQGSARSILINYAVRGTAGSSVTNSKIYQIGTASRRSAFWKHCVTQPSTKMN